MTILKPSSTTSRLRHNNCQSEGIKDCKIQIYPINTLNYDNHRKYIYRSKYIHMTIISTGNRCDTVSLSITSMLAVRDSNALFSRVACNHREVNFTYYICDECYTPVERKFQVSCLTLPRAERWLMQRGDCPTLPVACAYTGAYKSCRTRSPPCVILFAATRLQPRVSLFA